MRACRHAWPIVGIIVVSSATLSHAVSFPLTQVFDARAESGATTIMTRITVRVDRPMEESRRTRVTDTLRFSGYSNFVTALRGLPSIGSIELEKRKVDVRYAYEEPIGGANRLIIVGDRPLFFLAADAAKPRAGYELTVMELRFDAQGRASGTMAGAARVKPSPQGVQLDDYADIPVALTARTERP